MANIDVNDALRQIDKKIIELEKQLIEYKNTRKVVAAEFGGVNSPPPSPSLFSETTPQDKSLTRKQQLIKLLRNEGPLSRKEIRAKTSIPGGTMAYLFSKNKDIFKSFKGKWSLVKDCG